MRSHSLAFDRWSKFHYGLALQRGQPINGIDLHIARASRLGALVRRQGANVSTAPTRSLGT